MTKKELLEKLSQYDFISVDDWTLGNTNKNEIDITVQDFEGFSDDWEEILTAYDEDKFEELVELLEKSCNDYKDDYYSYYYYNDFYVVLGFASYDI